MASNEDRIASLPVTTDHSAALKQIQGLLKSKDDTSRFVGLALLKSVLDTQVQVRENQDQVKVLWESISPKFLDRLLRAKQNEKTSKDEARDMIDIAVAVLHTFASLLSSDVKDSKNFVGRVPTLENTLLESPAETSLLILQTILTMVSSPSGARTLLQLEDLSNLIEVASQYSLVLDIFRTAWSVASTESADVALVKTSVSKVMLQLGTVFHKTDTPTFLAFVASTLLKLDTEVVDDISDPWVTIVLESIRKLVKSRPTKQGRSAYTRAGSAFLQVFPDRGPALLFKDDELAAGNRSVSKEDRKPYSYLLITLLLVDIRSSYSSLLSNLNSSEYEEISERLAAAFNIISSFIGYLIRSLDDENVAGLDLMPPDLLLKIRKNIAETLSLAIEYLRDRYDAAIAGAQGLHPEARTGAPPTFQGPRLTLTWESKEHSIYNDPLILASIRTLAIWLKEDENENLRKESAGLMDLFIDLYKASAATPESEDFRSPVLLALEAIVPTNEGIEAFHAQDGWDILAAYLKNIATETIMAPLASQKIHSPSGPEMIKTIHRGVEIVRVMMAVLDNEDTTKPREHWMQVVQAAATLRPPAQPAQSSHSASRPPAPNEEEGEDPLDPPSSHPALADLGIAILQLATALLELAPSGMRRRYRASTTAILGAVAQMKDSVSEMSLPEGGAVELEEELDDITMSLENMR